jgi:hypothetical protein
VCHGVRGQVPAGAGGHQFGQQPVQPIERLGPGPGQLVAAVGQQPQHREVLIDDQLAQAAGAQGHHDLGVRVGGVGLAALSGVQHPDPGGELGRHIDDGLTVGQ